MSRKAIIYYSFQNFSDRTIFAFSFSKVCEWKVCAERKFEYGKFLSEKYLRKFVTRNIYWGESSRQRSIFIDEKFRRVKEVFVPRNNYE